MTEIPNPEILGQKFGAGMAAVGGITKAHMVHIGSELGLYRGMHGAGVFSSAELAAKLGLAERFVREWLFQQAASEIIEHRGGTHFEMLPEAGMVFADENYPLTMAKAIRYIPVMFEQGRSASNAFRTGIGRPYDGMGEQGARMMDAFFGGWNRSLLVSDALPRIPGVVEALQRGGKAADVGCGAGGAPIAVAAAFPGAEVHGYDNSVHALAVAEESRRASGLTNVTFHNPDNDPLPAEPMFDLVMTLDCLHDMARPDLVARAIRKAIKPEGAWFIVDIDAAPTPEENLKNPMAAMLFAGSVATCLQSSASTPDGMALGPLGLPEPAMRELVTNAGFTRFSRVNGLEHPVNAYYEVRP